MIVPLTHPFIRRCIDPEALLAKCFKFNTFAYRLEKQAEQYGNGTNDGWIRSPDNDLIQKYKGDGFELLVEAFIRMFGTDKKIGIDPQSYKIIEEGEDRGVDGSGIGINGKTHTIQAKYRQANYELHNNEDQLGNFKANSFAHPSSGGFGVDNTPDDNGKCNLTIIHSGRRIDPKTAQFMLSEVREITRRDIRRKVDGNNNFWNSFSESWKKALKSDEQ